MIKNVSNSKKRITSITSVRIRTWLWHNCRYIQLQSIATLGKAHSCAMRHAFLYQTPRAKHGDRVCRDVTEITKWVDKSSPRGHRYLDGMDDSYRKLKLGNAWNLLTVSCLSARARASQCHILSRNTVQIASFNTVAWRLQAQIKKVPSTQACYIQYKMMP